MRFGHQRAGLLLAAAAAATMLLAGCGTAQSIWNTHGPAAAKIGSLATVMNLMFIGFSIGMWVLFVYAFYRRRGELTEHEPSDAGGGEMWVAIGGILFPLVVLTGLFIAGLILMREFPIHGTKHDAFGPAAAAVMKPSILIVGHQWWWEIRYLNADPAKAFVTADELHLPAGRGVSIEVETADVMHSLWIPALNGKVDMIPSQPNFIRMLASTPGVYQGQCAEYCGIEHARMRLLAVVQTPHDYRAWLERQRRPGAQPATPAAQAGQTIFEDGACATCHTVRGTDAQGRIGPDLTHIGSRRMLASDMYPNNGAWLPAWCTNAQSLKPGAGMPSLPDFTGVQLSDLVDYLQQLK
jgi:cytochrome c oxidase subunit 2